MYAVNWISTFAGLKDCQNIWRQHSGSQRTEWLRGCFGFRLQGRGSILCRRFGTNKCPVAIRSSAVTAGIVNVDFMHFLARKECVTFGISKEVTDIAVVTGKPSRIHALCSGY
jgi:hypothetical protein